MNRRRRALHSNLLARQCLATVLLLSVACTTAPTPPPTAPLVVRLVAFNDFHGNLEPPSTPTRMPRPDGGSAELPTGGIEYLGTLVAQLKAQNPWHAVVA